MMPAATETKPYLVWDTCAIWSDQVKYLMEEEGASEKDAQEAASADQELYTWAWDDVTSLLTELMNRIGKGATEWDATVEGFGWRNQSGSLRLTAENRPLRLTAENGADFLQKVLPNTENTFKLYDMGDYIKIDNAHHDKPTGGEIYEIRPVKV